MRKVLLIGIVLLSMGWTLAVTRAQEAPTETFTAADGVSEIVFPSYDGGYYDLFSVEPTGTNLTQLTHEQRNASEPVWSPDGTKLAYMADTGQTGYAFDIFVVGADGANPVKLSSHPSDNVGAIAWSPDSKQLIFNSGRADTDGGPGLYRVNADGSGETKLTFDGVDGKFINHFTLDWSRDGKQIVFIAFPTAGPDYTLLFADPNGGAVTPGPKVNIAQVADYFKWSPDGQHILYSDNNTVTVMNPDGSSQTVLVNSSEGLFVQGVAWSPDGSQVAFTAYVLSSSEPVSQLYTVNADGSNRQPIDLGSQGISSTGLTWGIVPSSQAQNGASSSTEAPLVTATDGSHTVSMRAPDNWSVKPLQLSSKAEIALLENGPNHIGGEVDFPASAGVGSSAKAIAESFTNFAKGTVTEFQLDGREAARLDSVDSDGSTDVHLYIVVKTDAGDYVLIFFYGPADAMKAEEPTLLAMAASLTTGDPA
jgi:Tol biopolymer transport system component